MPAACALRTVAHISRVFPSPAAPDRNRVRPRPAAVAATASLSRSRISSRPTMIGHWTDPRRLIVRSVRRFRLPAIVIRRMAARGGPSRSYHRSVLPIDVIRQAPKVLLHDHLDGGLRPSTVIDLAAEYRYGGLPTTDPD